MGTERLWSPDGKKLNKVEISSFISLSQVKIGYICKLNHHCNIKVEIRLEIVAAIVLTLHLI